MMLGCATSARCVCAGWYNLLGQVAVTASIEFTLANHLVAMIVLATGGAGTGGHVFTQGQLLGIYAGTQLLALLSWTHLGQSLQSDGMLLPLCAGSCM